jgi:hypothetical protein
MTRESRLPPRVLVSFRRRACHVVPRRVRPDVVPFAPGVSVGQNGVGVRVLKGPQRPAVRVSGRQQKAWRGLVRSAATDGARRDW